RLLVVDVEPVLNHFRAIVVPLDQLRTALVALARHSRRLRLDVIDGAALRASAPARKPANELRVGDVKKHGAVDFATLLGQERVERLRLRERARKAVENEPWFAVRLARSLFDETDDDGVRNKLALVDVGLRFQAELGPLRNRRAKHVAGRNLGPA